MCHCGTLSITCQLFCPHHHSAEPERVTTGVQGFTMGVLGGDAIYCIIIGIILGYAVFLCSTVA